ncbi:MAG TPA: threonine dehydratase [Gammaproteobacteria bacterium]|nr:threonine dehydratase [Gammaproteobacteria bacterium]
MLTNGSLALDPLGERETQETFLSAVPARACARDLAVTLGDVEQAMEVVRKHLAPTRLLSHPLLNRRAGCEVFVKLENTQDIGSFKIRGGLNLLARMSAEDRARGLVTATRGNHGQSIAYAARMHGASCTIFVPRGNNADKNAAMAALGAQVVEAGHDFDAAMIAAEEFAARDGARLVHPARDLDLVAGVGTIALEMLQQAEGRLDAVFVPVGGGSIAAGMSVVLKALSPETHVIGVSAENAPAMHHAWHTGEHRPFAAVDTLADGLAVRVPVDVTLGLLRPLLDGMVLVSEREIQEAIRTYAETVHQMAEGAAAAALAAAMRHGGAMRGGRVGVVLTGGNIDAATLMSALAGERPQHQPQAMPYFPIGELSYGY